MATQCFKWGAIDASLQDFCGCVLAWLGLHNVSNNWFASFGNLFSLWAYLGRASLKWSSHANSQPRTVGALH